MSAGSIDDAVAAGMPGYTMAPSRGLESKVELEQAVPWVIKRAKGKDTQRALDESRTKLADSQRGKIDLVVRQLKRVLVDVSLVETVWSRLMASFRSRVLGMPSKLAGMLVGIADANVIKAKIEAECIQALAELSDEGFLREASAGASVEIARPDAATAAPANGKRVGRRESPAVE